MPPGNNVLHLGNNITLTTSRDAKFYIESNRSPIFTVQSDGNIIYHFEEWNRHFNDILLPLRNVAIVGTWGLGNGWTTETGDGHLRFKHNGEQKLVVHNPVSGNRLWTQEFGYLTSYAATSTDLASTKADLATTKSDYNTRLTNAVGSIETLKSSSLQCNNGQCRPPSGSKLGVGRWTFEDMGDGLHFHFDGTSVFQFQGNGDLHSTLKVGVISIVRDYHGRIQNAVNYGDNLNICHWNNRGCLMAGNAWDARTTDNPWGDWEMWRIGRR